CPAVTKAQINGNCSLDTHRSYRPLAEHVPKQHSRNREKGRQPRRYAPEDDCVRWLPPRCPPQYNRNDSHKRCQDEQSSVAPGDSSPNERYDGECNVCVKW